MQCRMMESPIGMLLLEAQEGCLCGVRLAEAGKGVVNNVQEPVLLEAERQIRQYFAGVRQQFEIPLKMQGSAFDRAVWEKLMEIPFEEIRTYGQIAGVLGRPKAARAVGGACSRNPLLIVVPCHRVVASSGKLTGFAAGLAAKRILLEHEGRRIKGDYLVFDIEQK